MPDKPAPPKKKESTIALIRRGYGNLVNTVVRPPRVAYTDADLGPRTRSLRGAVYVRRDFDVILDKLKLRCSRWAPAGDDAVTKVVLYLHSNSSCRLAVVRSPVLATCACAGAALVAFDFAGCGVSDGDYVTLGMRERDQVEAVLLHIRAWAPSSKICVWGRSMGAAAALLHQENHGGAISGLILDSPFLSFRALKNDLIQRAAPKAPRCGVACVMCCLGCSVRRRTRGCDATKVDCGRAAAKARAPALFLAGARDRLAAPATHAAPLEARYAAPSALLVFDGEHNSPRPSWVYDRCATFLAAALDDAPGLAAALLGTFAEAPPAVRRPPPPPMTSPRVMTADVSDEE
jgi:hypothetical protein